jgi:hypothetical protein
VESGNDARSLMSHLTKGLYKVWHRTRKKMTYFSRTRYCRFERLYWFERSYVSISYVLSIGGGKTTPSRHHSKYK